MKRLLVMLSLVSAVVHIEAAAARAIPPAGATAITTFLQGAASRGEIPGMVALVVGRDGVLYHEAFGTLNVAGGTAMTKDAIFRIASMTKPITSVGVMMLVEDGKLRLDDDVAKYLPQFKSPKVVTSINEKAGTFETRPAKRAITIRHLLTHTSGLGYAWSDPTEAFLQRTLKQTEPEMPLVRDPGERWTYSASTRVLGDVIEKVSGQRIDAFLKARILDPLGMKDTSYGVSRSAYGRVVTVHQRIDGKLVEQANTEPLQVSVRGDGGLYSTASDYARFIRMFLNKGELDGKRLLSERTVREMTQNQIGSLVIEQQPTSEPARSKPYPLGAGHDKWGLGFQLAVPRGKNAYGRSAGSYSWAGINNTHFWVDPPREIGAILLMQVLPFYDDDAIKTLRGFEELVYRALGTT